MFTFWLVFGMSSFIFLNCDYLLFSDCLRSKGAKFIFKESTINKSANPNTVEKDLKN